MEYRIVFNRQRRIDGKVDQRKGGEIKISG